MKIFFPVLLIFLNLCPPLSAQTKTRIFSYVIEPIIVGAISGFVAVRAAESYNATPNITAPKHWLKKDYLSVHWETTGFLRDGSEVKIPPGRYYVILNKSRNNTEFAVIENTNIRKLIVIFLE